MLQLMFCWCKLHSINLSKSSKRNLINSGLIMFLLNPKKVTFQTPKEKKIITKVFKMGLQKWLCAIWAACKSMEIWPVKQPDGLVNGHPPAAFFRLAVSLVSCVHVFLREVAAQEIKVGRVHSDKPRIQHVLYLHREVEVLQELRCTFKKI